VLQLVHVTEPANGDDYSKRDERFNTELLRLLANPDVAVRRNALAVIGWNWNNAEMFQVHFGQKVSERLKSLKGLLIRTKSGLRTSPPRVSGKSTRYGSNESQKNELSRVVLCLTLLTRCLLPLLRILPVVADADLDDQRYI
jgi:hypothetical protein